MESPARFRIGCSLISLLILAGPRSALAGAVTYIATTPDGNRYGPALANGEHLKLPLGATVALLIDKDCRSAKVSKALFGSGTSIGEIKDSSLPTTLVTGDNWTVRENGTVEIQVEVTQTDDSKHFETMSIEVGGQRQWWTIADTVAYAVTRQSGNTAIAGAGLFVDVPDPLFGKWKFLTDKINKLHGVLQYSVVLHLLPPGNSGAADLGIAPIGIGLFGNRIVAGVGWNISRRGQRDDSHNRYVYFGISASKLLSPKLSSNTGQ